MSRAGAPETSSQPSRGRAARSSDAQHSFQVTFSAHCIVLCPGVVRVENIVSAASRASRSSSTLPPAMSQASARLRIVVAPPNLVTYSLALAHESQGHPERIGLLGSSGDPPTAYQTYRKRTHNRARYSRGLRLPHVPLPASTLASRQPARLSRRPVRACDHKIGLDPARSRPHLAGRPA